MLYVCVYAYGSLKQRTRPTFNYMIVCIHTITNANITCMHLSLWYP